MVWFIFVVIICYAFYVYKQYVLLVFTIFIANIVPNKIGIDNQYLIKMPVFLKCQKIRHSVSKN